MPAISDELHLRMLILKFLCFVDVFKGESFSFSSWLFLWFSLSLSRRQAIEIKLFLFRISCESLRRLCDSFKKRASRWREFRELCEETSLFLRKNTWAWWMRGEKELAFLKFRFQSLGKCHTVALLYFCVF